MTPMPIEWHEECVKNMLSFQSELIFRRNQLEREIAALEEGIILRKRQIVAAKTGCKTLFDHEKFLIKRQKA